VRLLDHRGRRQRSDCADTPEGNTFVTVGPLHCRRPRPNGKKPTASSRQFAVGKAAATSSFCPKSKSYSCAISSSAARRVGESCSWSCTSAHGRPAPLPRRPPAEQEAGVGSGPYRTTRSSGNIIIVLGRKRARAARFARLSRSIRVTELRRAVVCRGRLIWAARSTKATRDHYTARSGRAVAGQSAVAIGNAAGPVASNSRTCRGTDRIELDRPFVAVLVLVLPLAVVVVAAAAASAAAVANVVWLLFSSPRVIVIPHLEWRPGRRGAPTDARLARAWRRRPAAR
jgi:hypothetical protein